MAATNASSDIVTLAIVLGLSIFLDIFAYKHVWAWASIILYIASIMIDVYALGTVFTQQSVTYSVAQLQTNSTFFTTYTINGGMWAVIFAVMVLVTFILLYSDIETRTV